MAFLECLPEQNSGYIQNFRFLAVCKDSSVKNRGWYCSQSLIAEMDLLECLPRRFRFLLGFRFPRLAPQWRAILRFRGCIHRVRVT